MKRTPTDHLSFTARLARVFAVVWIALCIAVVVHLAGHPSAVEAEVPLLAFLAYVLHQLMSWSSGDPPESPSPPGAAR